MGYDAELRLRLLRASIAVCIRRLRRIPLYEVFPRSEGGDFAPEPGQCPRRVSRVAWRYLCHDHHVLLVRVVVDDHLNTTR